MVSWPLPFTWTEPLGRTVGWWQVVLQVLLVHVPECGGVEGGEDPRHPLGGLQAPCLPGALHPGQGGVGGGGGVGVCRGVWGCRRM